MNSEMTNCYRQEYPKVFLLCICNRMGPRAIVRINFTRIFKVFTKLPKSRSDEGNLKLILYCTRAHWDYTFIT